MILTLKIHILIEILTLIISLFIIKEKKSLLLLILPGAFIFFSSPFLLYVLKISEKDREIIDTHDKYELLELIEPRPEPYFDKKVLADSETLFYSFRERIIPENHALYFIKNMTKKYDSEVVILSCAALMHKEQELLWKIYKEQEAIDKEKNVENIINLCSAYYNYCYFGYANDKLRNQFSNTAINIIESLCPINSQAHYEINFIAGKFYLLLEKFDMAHEAFSNVLKCDVTNSSLVSYLAEINFYNGNLRDMKDILKWLSMEDSVNENIREVIEYWNG